MNRSETIVELAGALVEAQKEIANAVKDKVNPHYKSKYADLSSVAEACKKPLNDHGIAYIQTAEPCEAGQLSLTTALIHKSGQWISGTCTMPVQQNTPQAYGSALTYARRYGLAAMVGVCPDDDDAEGAEGRGQKRTNAKYPDADEQFDIRLREALGSREFPERQHSSLISAICKRRDIASIFDLSADDRKHLVDKISAGEFDALKNGRKPVGAK